MLADNDDVAWDLFRDGVSRPQYIVLDEDQMITARGEGRDGHESTQAAVLELLSE